MAHRPKPDRATGPEGVVALSSGGLDSAVMLARALAAGRSVWPLFVRQGALWEDAEEATLRRFLMRLPQTIPGSITPNQLASLIVLRLDLPPHYASHWAIDPARPVPDEATSDKSVYLPGRNLALLLHAANLAQSLSLSTIQIGMLAGNPFADSTPAFRHAFTALYAQATGYQIQVEAPLAGLDKSAVIRAGAGLPLEETFSCLRPVDGRHCGHCNKCAERRRGFAAAALPDPTLYAATSALIA